MRLKRASHDFRVHHVLLGAAFTDAIDAIADYGETWQCVKTLYPW